MGFRNIFGNSSVVVPRAAKFFSLQVIGHISNGIVGLTAPSPIGRTGDIRITSIKSSALPPRATCFLLYNATAHWSAMSVLQKGNSRPLTFLSNEHLGRQISATNLLAFQENGKSVHLLARFPAALRRLETEIAAYAEGQSFDRWKTSGTATNSPAARYEYVG